MTLQFLSPSKALVNDRLLLEMEEYLQDGEKLCSVTLSYPARRQEPGLMLGSILLELDHPRMGWQEFRSYANNLVETRAEHIEEFLGRFDEAD